MENNADNQFPDLLSAALSESGLTDDLDDFDVGGGEQHMPPAQTIAHSFTTQPRIQYISSPAPSPGGLASVSPSTVQLLGRRVVSGNQVLVNRNQASSSTPGTPMQKIVKVIQTPVRDAAGNTQTVKKIVIQRAAPTGSVNTNQAARLVTLPSGQVVNVPRAALPASVSSQAIPVTQLQSIGGSGGYKVIRMASPITSAGGVTAAATGQVVTVPTADGKRYRIIPVRAAAPGGPVIARPSSNTGVTIGNIRSSPASATSQPKILKIVSSQPGSGLTKTIVVTSSGVASVGNAVNSATITRIVASPASLPASSLPRTVLASSTIQSLNSISVPSGMTIPARQVAAPVVPVTSVVTTTSNVTRVVSQAQSQIPIRPVLSQPSPLSTCHSVTPASQPTIISQPSTSAPRPPSASPSPIDSHVESLASQSSPQVQSTTENSSFLDSFSKFLSGSDVSESKTNSATGDVAIVTSDVPPADDIVDVETDTSVTKPSPVAIELSPVTTPVTDKPCEVRLESTTCVASTITTTVSTSSAASQPADIIDSPPLSQTADGKTSSPTPTTSTNAMNLMDMLGADDGESNDVDFFTAALQQLTDTNKKAEEIAERSKIEDEKKNKEVTPSMTSAVNTLSSAESVSVLSDSTAPNRTLQRVQTLTLPHSPGSPGERSSSPVSILPRIGSPSLLKQRAGSPLGFQSSTPQVIQIVQDGKIVTATISVPSSSPATFSLPQPHSNIVGDMASTPLRSATVGADALQRRRMMVQVKSESQLPVSEAIKAQLTDKDVSRLWVNDDIKLKSFTPPVPRVSSLAQVASASGILPPGFVSPIEDEVEEEDEELGHAETYAEYMPAKSKIGEKHPDPVVETSSLSSVEAPDIGYQLSIPEHVIDCRLLSALQLESIVYASQKQETFLPSGDRAGFLIGDGAGVGKGRTIAGIIFENYLQGRKRSLWLSVSNDLKVDAERDLQDIGAGKIDVHPLNKFKYAKISSHINNSVKKGVIFATYSSLIGESQSGGKYKTRFKQLIHWLGKDFDGVIVFDECHRAKNLCPVGSAKPTKTGLTVLELQNRLPKARVIYASATGASEPRNMAYMTRLGLWGKGTPFTEFNEFIQAVEKRGVGAMELVAMDMKLRGIYIARQLSFHGVSFKVEEIPLDKDYIKIYNSAVRLWVEARDLFQQAADLIDAEHRMKKTMWGQFWSAHQRFFKYMCISAKVQRCLKLARDAVKHGKCVVIGLQSTGEARTLEQVEDMGGELNDFVSTAKGVIQSLVEKHFPAPDRKKTMDLFGGNLFDDSPVPSPKGSKRKLKSGRNGRLKKAKFMISDSEGSSSSSQDEDDSSEDEPRKKSASESEKEESDLIMSSSENEDMASDEDNFNPFGNGSDSDDDPWLKKKKGSPMKPKPTKNKSSKDLKEMENKKKKKKDKKRKKKKKKSKKRKADESSSDDDFDDIDHQMDIALESAGLKTKDSFIEPVKNTALPAADAVERAIAMKRDLLIKIERLGDQLPANTLDELIDQLGGPENVAEMTGRKGRVVSTDDGSIQYESRSEMDAPLEILNLTEKQRFMDGEKNVAIISEAASSGISLQADRRVVNQKRRVHITLELPWSADRAIQQFGRTHRSNQVSAPEYVFLISELAGEQRFASTVAKRLESLGALTHGDRRATESRDLSRFNFDNKYGRAALESAMRSILGYEKPMVPFPATYVGDFAKDVRHGLVGVGMVTVDIIGNYMLEKDYNSMSKFLNRILGMEVDQQNALFLFFSQTLAAVVLQAKHNGRWDMGIVDLGTSGENVKVLDSKVFRGNFSGATTSVTLVTVSVERGMSWNTAMAVWRDHDGESDGFYISTQSRSEKKLVLLAVAIKDRRRLREYMYNVFRPNTGQQAKQETLAQIKLKYKKVYPDDARYHWENSYDSSELMCSHAFWKGSCRKQMVGLQCDTGIRRRKYHVLCGSVLSVWTSVERVLASLPGGHATRMQIIRLRTDEGKRIVGSLIPVSAISPLTSMLSDHTKSKPPLPTPVHHAVRVANPFESPWERQTQSLTAVRQPLARSNTFPSAMSPLINLSQGRSNVVPRVMVNTTPRGAQTQRVIVNTTPQLAQNRHVFVNSTPRMAGQNRHVIMDTTPRMAGSNRHVIVNAPRNPHVVVTTTPRQPQPQRVVINQARPQQQNPRLLGFSSQPPRAPSQPVNTAVAVAGPSSKTEGEDTPQQVLSMPLFL